MSDERLDFLNGEKAVEAMERIAKGNVHASSPADVPAMIAGLAHHIDAMRSEVAFQSNWTHDRHNALAAGAMGPETDIIQSPIGATHETT